MTLPTTFTVDEVAASLRISTRTVRNLIKRGACSPIRIGDGDKAPYRFTQADYEALESALRPAAAVPDRKRRRRRAA